MPMPARPYEADANGLRIRVRLTPRGGRDALEGVDTLADGRAVLRARVRAAPEKGLVNAALESLLAKSLRVPKSTVSVVAGGTGRVKVVAVSGRFPDLAETVEALLCVKS
jgi:uncharacterized protein